MFISDSTDVVTDDIMLDDFVTFFIAGKKIFSFGF